MGFTDVRCGTGPAIRKHARGPLARDCWRRPRLSLLLNGSVIRSCGSPRWTAVASSTICASQKSSSLSWGGLLYPLASLLVQARRTTRSPSRCEAPRPRSHALLGGTAAMLRPVANCNSTRGSAFSVLLRRPRRTPQSVVAFFDWHKVGEAGFIVFILLT